LCVSYLPPVFRRPAGTVKRLSEVIYDDDAPKRQKETFWRKIAAQWQHQLLERAQFDRLCDEEGGISDKGPLLDFLHHSGVIFYRPRLSGLGRTRR
jgi:hypothetical protein